MKFCALTQYGTKNAPAGKHADGQGLWLVKSGKARGKWVLRIFVAGKRREMGLGGWPEVSIAEARERAAAARKTGRDLTDPIEARRKAKRVAHRLSVKEAIEDCFDARKAQLKGEGVAGRWKSPLDVHVIPKIGSTAIEDVDQHVLKELLASIWHEKPEAAVKALNRMSLTIKHAAALGLSVDMQACMKARALLGAQRRTTTHIPSLPYQDAPAFYQWLCTVDGVSALALRFLMLTCARTSEVRLATFDEIDGNVWTLPAGRTKTGVERRIPLTAEALRVVELCRKRSKHYLFPAHRGQPISDAAMATLMKRNDYEARPHGFRATFRTWCEEATNADYETKESALGHVVDVGVAGAYQRSDRFEKRRSLLRDWTKTLSRTRVSQPD